MRTLNIFKKSRGRKAILIHTVHVEDSFNAAVEATRTYTLSLGKNSAKIFWNWADSAWDRQR
jgi:hypothetical protein